MTTQLPPSQEEAITKNNEPVAGETEKENSEPTTPSRPIRESAQNLENSLVVTSNTFPPKGN